MTTRSRAWQKVAGAAGAWRCPICAMPSWRSWCANCLQPIQAVPAAAASAAARNPPPITAAAAALTQPIRHLATGLFDNLLAGGPPFGGVILLAGEPGAGKSTLAQQWCAAAAASGRTSLYITGEQMAGHAAASIGRVAAGAPLEKILILAGPHHQVAAEAIPAAPAAALVIIDSLQAVGSFYHGPGSPGALAAVTRAAIATAGGGAAVVLVSQIERQGGVRGGRGAEHLVDGVLFIRAPRPGAPGRELILHKYRFGPTNRAQARMTAAGLVEVRE